VPTAEPSHLLASEGRRMLSFALTALASILSVVDPLGALPAYLAT
jgi:hypothetical protein